MTRISLMLFFAAASADVISRLAGWNVLHWVTKPLIVTSLLVYYVLATSRRSIRVIMALVFSLAGDIALLFSGDNAFILGLAAFLVAHLFYIFAFQEHRIPAEDDALKGLQRIRLALPIVLAGTGLIIILYPALGDLRYPVVGYACILVLMVLQTLFRYGRTNATSFWMVFTGGLLFMVSDSILALHKFLGWIEQADALTMITYASAQLFLIDGLCRHAER